MTMTNPPVAAPGSIGHNSQIPTPTQVTEELSMRFGDMLTSTASLVADATELPVPIKSQADLGIVSQVIIKARELAKRAESTREAEKGPYYRAGLSVDAFFKKSIMEKLATVSTRLDRAVNDYQQAILAAERARRAAEQRAAEEEARKAAEKAARARAEERKVQTQIDADLAERRRVEAEEAAQQTAAGMTRTRFEDGPLVSMRTVKFAEITNISDVDLLALRPYLKPSAIEDAVKRWAVATEYRATMPGVKVGEREESIVR